MDQMKKALLEAGVLDKEMRHEIQKDKVLRRHKRHDKRDRKDQISIICDVCDKSAPDVEKYGHNNRLIRGKYWLCVRCADENQINDDCRTTHQSTQAKSGLFIRQYGRTKKFKGS